MEKEKKTADIQKEQEEIDLLIQVIWRHRHFIITSVLLATIASAIISFLLPKIYSSESVIIPISKSPANELFPPNIPYIRDQGVSNIKAVLNSVTIRERVIKDLNLLGEILKNEKKYKLKDPYQFAARKIKRDVKTIDDRRLGTIKIVVDWKDPATAQRINESLIKNLRDILNEKALTLAKMNRILYEREFSKANEELKEAVKELSIYQKQKKAILPEQQLKNQMEIYASLIKEKVETEAKLKTLMDVYSQEAPQIKELQNRLIFINQKLSELEGDINIKTPLSPDRTLLSLPEYTQLYIKVEQLRSKSEVLAKLLEQSRLEELKESLFVEVIDPPSFPEFPSKPKKMLIVLTTFIASLFLSIIFVNFSEFIKNRYKAST